MDKLFICIPTYIQSYLTFKDMIFISASKTMKFMKALGYMVCNCVWQLQLYKYHDIYMDYMIGVKTFDCQMYAE